MHRTQTRHAHDQNFPAKLRAASDAEILDLPLAVPDEPELSVPNGFGLELAALGRCSSMDCVPGAAPAALLKPEANGSSCVLPRDMDGACAACIDWDRLGVPMGEAPDHALGVVGIGERTAGCCGGGEEALFRTEDAELEDLAMLSVGTMAACCCSRPNRRSQCTAGRPVSTA